MNIRNLIKEKLADGTITIADGIGILNNKNETLLFNPLIENWEQINPKLLNRKVQYWELQDREGLPNRHNLIILVR